MNVSNVCAFIRIQRSIDNLAISRRTRLYLFVLLTSATRRVVIFTSFWKLVDKPAENWFSILSLHFMSCSLYQMTCMPSDVKCLLNFP